MERSTLPEPCPGCGFDPAAWTDTDIARTLHHTGDLLSRWTATVDDERFGRPPTDGAWSVADHVARVAAVHRATAQRLAGAVDARSGPDLPETGGAAQAGPGPAGDRDRGLTDAAEAGAALHRSLVPIRDRGWDRAVTGAPGPPGPAPDAATLSGSALAPVDPGRAATLTVRDLAHQAAHQLWHHLTAVAVVAAELGCRPRPTNGAVTGLHRSDGGVPKTRVDSATVDFGGVVGDRQATRIHHGRPWQALCLWSIEVIDELRAEGHPVGPGGAGENVTVTGIDWSTVEAGDVLELGTVRCQLTAPAAPCATIAANFSDGDSLRIDHDRHPGTSRWYASVLIPGSLAVGDPVLVRPATRGDGAAPATARPGP